MDKRDTPETAEEFLARIKEGGIELTDETVRAISGGVFEPDPEIDYRRFHIIRRSDWPEVTVFCPWCRARGMMRLFKTDHYKCDSCGHVFEAVDYDW